MFLYHSCSEQYLDKRSSATLAERKYKKCKIRHKGELQRNFCLEMLLNCRSVWIHQAGSCGCLQVYCLTLSFQETAMWTGKNLLVLHYIGLILNDILSLKFLYVFFSYSSFSKICHAQKHI